MVVGRGSASNLEDAKVCFGRPSGSNEVRVSKAWFFSTPIPFLNLDPKESWPLIISLSVSECPFCL